MYAGPSCIVGVGDYGCGGLWVQDLGEVDCKHKWEMFDGNQPHCTLPYTGNTRYTLIYFCNQSYSKLVRDWVVNNKTSNKQNTFWPIRLLSMFEFVFGNSVLCKLLVIDRELLGPNRVKNVNCNHLDSPALPLVPAAGCGTHPTMDACQM